MIGEAGLTLLVAAAIGYLFGSIPFGLLVTRLAGATDPRTIGSGNIGATNVLRTGHKGLAALTLLLDAAKGALAVAAIGIVWPEPPAHSLPAVVAGGCAFIGHVYPVWLRFRGGKGVAILLGLAIALFWPCGVVFAAVWLAAFGATRQSSVGGLAAAAAVPVAAAIFNLPELTLLFLLLATIVLWKHRANIERLLDGTEPRFGARG